MKIFFVSVLALVITFNSNALEINADLFTYDEEKVESELNNLSELEEYIIKNKLLYDNSSQIVHPFFSTTHYQDNLATYSPAKIYAPGNLPSFWFTFTLSAIGTYTIYGVVAGPISVGIVYFSTDRDKKETNKALWGCITGTIIGAGIKYAVVNMM